MENLPSPYLFILFLACLISFGLGFLLKRFLSTKKINSSVVKSEPEIKKIIEPDINYLQERTIWEGIFQSIEEGILVVNEGGLLIWSNRKALEILKTAWVTIQNKPITEVLPITQQENNNSNLRLKLSTWDGETIFISVKVYPLINDQQGVKVRIYVIQDITEGRALEEMKLDFVAIAAHQLRTPLTAIKGYLALLSESAPPKLDNEEQMFLQRTIISTERLGVLIENLLNVSRVEKGALKIHFRPVSLEDVVRDTVEQLWGNAKEKNVHLVLDPLTPPYPKVMGDAMLLQEALSNLVTNGIKYNHPGGQVTITLQKQADGNSIHVTDTGIGIPAEAQPHLFQRFYQATSSLSKLSSGLGLGLYICKSIIEAHKGKIWINSLEGKGTTVSIFLPSSTNNP